MLILAGLLLRVIALGMQAVPASGLHFTNFTSISQCEPFTIHFTGLNLTATQVPAFLSFIPVNSTAISAPLVNPALVSDGVFVPSLPFRADSNFLASLDDSNGENLIFVSDLVRVTASDNTTCLPPVSTDPQRRFSLATGVAQCQQMTLKYDTSVVSKAPIVRLYSPIGRSFILNSTSDNPSTGEAKYLVNFPRGREVVFLMSSGDNIRETSPVITVGGDAASDTACLRGLNVTATSSTPNDNTDSDDSVVGNNSDANPPTQITSRSVIIGSAVGGSVVVLIALAMAIFVIRDRRRRRKARLELKDSPDLEKPESEKNFDNSNPSNLQEKSNPGSNGRVSNPVYARLSSLLSPMNSKYRRGSLASWAQATPDDQRFSNRSPVSPTTRVVVQSPRSINHESLEFSDIEGMLNLAAMQSENNASRKNSQATSLSNYPTLTVPTSTLLGPDNTRFHRREPSDVPGGPDSMAFSGYSVNPFDSRHPSLTPSILKKNLRTSLNGGNVGLPSSPRDVRGVGNGRRLSRISGRSSSDWYGIAR